jgi:hypothetical protein
MHAPLPCRACNHPTRVCVHTTTLTSSSELLSSCGILDSLKNAALEGGRGIPAAAQASSSPPPDSTPPLALGASMGLRLSTFVVALSAQHASCEPNGAAYCRRMRRAGPLRTLSSMAERTGDACPPLCSLAQLSMCMISQQFQQLQGVVVHRNLTLQPTSILQDAGHSMQNQVPEA